MYRLIDSPLYPSAITKSRKPWLAYIFMMCQRIGRPPISTIGFGFVTVSSARRLPTPPAKMTTFMFGPPPTLASSLHRKYG